MVSARPAWPGMRPMASGRKPRGSRAAKMRSRRHHDQRKRAFDAAQRVGHGFRQRLLVRLRDQMHDDFGVAGGLENRALALQPCADFMRIDQVAVVRQRDHALVALHQDGLRVEQRGVAGGGVARVPDGQRAAEASRARLR